MATSNVSVIISEGIGEESSLEWDLVDEDNNDPECYLIGQPYFIRLYKSPDNLDPCVFNTNGNINFLEEIEDEITETIIFNGSQIQNLSAPFFSNLSYEIIGNVYGSVCSLFSAVTFSVSIGTSEIIASIPCYAVLEITYSTKFYKYRFSGYSAGVLMIGALDTNDSEEVTSIKTIELYENCSSIEEDCPVFYTEIVNTDDDTVNYDNEEVQAIRFNNNTKLIRIYNANRSDVKSFVATKGTARYIGVGQEEREEFISVCSGEISIEKPAYKIIEQKTISGNLNPVILQADGSVRMLDDPNIAKGGVPSGYGAIYIKYMTRFLNFIIEGTDGGKGVFLLEHIDDDDSCSPQCLEYELGINEGNKIYDITVIYRDFVTGAPLSEVKVWVDNSYIGETDDSGEILIKGISANVKHLIRGSKPGYLKSDSDSLANDSFIIRDDTSEVKYDYSGDLVTTDKTLFGIKR